MGTFPTILNWVIAHGYLLFFVACFIEGPIVTTAAGVAVALGYFNIFFIIGVSVLGDLAADCVYYAIGYFGGAHLISRYGSKMGLTPVRVEKMTNLLHGHLNKTMVLVKVSPLIPIPGLILIGSVRAPIKKFVRASLLITLPKSILFAMLGFYFAKAYQQLGGLIKNSEYALFGIVIVFFLIYFAYNKFASSVTKELA